MICSIILFDQVCQFTKRVVSWWHAQCTKLDTKLWKPKKNMLLSPGLPPDGVSHVSQLSVQVSRPTQSAFHLAICDHDADTSIKDSMHWTLAIFYFFFSGTGGQVLIPDLTFVFQKIDQPSPSHAKCRIRIAQMTASQVSSGINTWAHFCFRIFFIYFCKTISTMTLWVSQWRPVRRLQIEPCFQGIAIATHESMSIISSMWQKCQGWQQGIALDSVQVNAKFKLTGQALARCPCRPIMRHRFLCLFCGGHMMSANWMGLREVCHSSIRVKTAHLDVTQMFWFAIPQVQEFSFFMIEELPPPRK